MDSLVAAIFVFTLWVIIGLPIASLLSEREDTLRTILLAPAIGVATLVLVLFWISSLGLPVGTVARPLTGVLVFASLTFLWAHRRQLHWPSLAPVALGMGAALLTVGWPAVLLGSEWLGLANDDMSNYVLEGHVWTTYSLSERFGGTANILNGRDFPSAFTWQLNLGFLERPGSQLLLAWIGSLLGFSTFYAFMPAILAMHLCLVASTSSLAYRRDQKFRAALAAALLSVSPLTLYGTLNQLIGQVGGLAFLAAICTALGITICKFTQKRGYVAPLTLGLLGATLLIWYGEVLAFALAAAGGGFVLASLRSRSLLSPQLRDLVAGGALAALACGYYARDVIWLIWTRFAAPGGRLDVAPLFPQFLVPSGLGALWGFQDMNRPGTEPWLSISIALGALLLMLLLGWAIRIAWQGELEGLVLLLMAVPALPLFLRQDGFNLLKLSMFIQPFMVGTLVSLIARIANVRRNVALVLSCLLSCAVIPTALSFTSAAAGDGTVIEMAPGTQVNRALRSLATQHTGTGLLSDTAHPMVSKFTSIYFSGTSINFPSRDYFVDGAVLIKGVIQPSDCAQPAHYRPSHNWSPRDRDIWSGSCERLQQSVFNMTPTDGATNNRFIRNTFGVDESNDQRCSSIIQTVGEQSILNRQYSKLIDSDYFRLHQCSSVNNWLIFIHSEYGEHFYAALNDKSRTAIWQVEKDPLGSRSMAGIGRHLLFEIINPTDPIYVLVDITKGYSADGENLLPPATVIGRERSRLPLVGRGSARVRTGPVHPQLIDGRWYIAIDMGTDGTLFSDQRTGLMNLYGRDVALDIRRLTAFARDISIVTEPVPSGQVSPSMLNVSRESLHLFRGDYSGLYEDGWASEHFSIALNQTTSHASLVLKGEIPLVDDSTFQTHLDVLIDDTPVKSQLLGLGTFALSIPSDSRPGIRTVEVRTNRVQRLPAGDTRPVSMILREIGFESSQPDEGLPKRLPQSELGHRDQRHGGMSADGWLAKHSWVELQQPADDAILAFSGMVPAVNNTDFATMVRLSIDGVIQAEELLRPGEFSLTPKASSHQGAHRVAVEFTQTQLLPEPDNRHVGALLRSIEFLPSSVQVSPLRERSEVTSTTPDQLDIVDSGITPGSGWFEYEQYDGESFRWMGQEAQLLLGSPYNTATSLELLVEPGPGVESSRAVISITDRDDTVLAHQVIDQRQVVRVDLRPHQEGHRVLTVRVENSGSGVITAGDPRQLDLRVFWIREPDR